MKKCTLYHTGVYNSAPGVIKNNKVYLQAEKDQFFLPEEMFMAREECEGGLIQFEVQGKWGFADIYTGKIVIRPTWDFAGPFYHGYAHVALGVELEIDNNANVYMQGGKHGYIDTTGEITLPIDYDDAKDIPFRQYFVVAKDGKWGIVDRENKTLLPFQWDSLRPSCEHHLIFCRLDLPVPEAKEDNTRNWKWGGYDENFELNLELELDREPFYPTINASSRSRNYNYYREYFILQNGKKYGLLCKDGRLIVNVELTKKQVKAMINMICGQSLAGSLNI